MLHALEREQAFPVKGEHERGLLERWQVLKHQDAQVGPQQREVVIVVGLQVPEGYRGGLAAMYDDSRRRESVDLAKSFDGRGGDAFLYPPPLRYAPKLRPRGTPPAGGRGRGREHAGAEPDGAGAGRRAGAAGGRGVGGGQQRRAGEAGRAGGARSADEGAAEVDAAGVAALPVPPGRVSSPCRSRHPARRRHRRHRPAAPGATAPTTARTPSAAEPPGQRVVSPARQPAPRSPPAAVRSPRAAPPPAAPAPGSHPVPHPAHPAAMPQHPPNPGQHRPQPPRSTANILTSRKSRTPCQRVAAHGPRGRQHPHHTNSEYLRQDQRRELSHSAARL